MLAHKGCVRGSDTRMAQADLPTCRPAKEAEQPSPDPVAPGRAGRGSSPEPAPDPVFFPQGCPALGGAFAVGWADSGEEAREGGRPTQGNTVPLGKPEPSDRLPPAASGEKPGSHMLQRRSYGDRTWGGRAPRRILTLLPPGAGPETRDRQRVARQPGGRTGTRVPAVWLLVCRFSVTKD